MKRAYLYPITGRDDQLGLYNPYLDDFMGSQDGNIEIVNKNDPSKTGLLNIIKYLFRIDIVFFNWIENIPDRKGGRIQAGFLSAFLFLAPLLGIRVVWTMHNKLSHTKENYRRKKNIFRRMLRKSDLILTHSRAGIAFGEELVPGSGTKIHYLPHPVKDRRLKATSQRSYDILIWGTIAPYKGIHDFLDYLVRKNLQDRYRIYVVGKITSPAYAEKIMKYTSENIRIENKFIEDDLLQELIARSGLVLFTYSQESILSSGVLMDSLGYGANIIGPAVGAFADLAGEGIISTFRDYHHMIEQIDAQLKSAGSSERELALNKFLEDNSWPAFAGKFSGLLQR